MIYVKVYYQIIFLQLKLFVEMQQLQRSSMYQCKPWETMSILGQLNLLQNFKKNLYCYEQGYKRLTIKSKCQLPLIQPQKINSNIKLRDNERLVQANKSVELPRTEGRKVMMNRQYDIGNKQNRPLAPSDRVKNKSDLKTKVLKIAFEDQNRYKPMKKREIHQVIFGQKFKRQKRETIQ